MVYRHATNNPMGPFSVDNVPTGPSRMREPPPDSRFDQSPDPDVHEFYRGFVYDLCSFF